MSLKLLKTIVSIAALWPELSQAEQMPPLGKRIYIIHEKGSPDPVEIKNIHKNQRYMPGTMRDPILEGEGHQAKKVIDLAPTVQAKKVSRMAFDRVAVQGRYLVPRVRFDRQNIPIGLQEPKEQVSYRKKIQQSHEESHDFEW